MLLAVAASPSGGSTGVTARSRLGSRANSVRSHGWWSAASRSRTARSTSALRWSSVSLSAAPESSSLAGRGIGTAGVLQRRRPSPADARADRRRSKRRARRAESPGAGSAATRPGPRAVTRRRRGTRIARSGGSGCIRAGTGLSAVAADDVASRRPAASAARLVLPVPTRPAAVAIRLVR
jgi:hypothetical protein